MHAFVEVPAGRSDALQDALGWGADALIVPLADTPEAATEATIRDRLCAALDALRDDPRRPLIYVAVSLACPTLEADLRAILSHEPDGLLLRAAEAGLDVEQLGAKLAVLEAELDLADGSTTILAEAGVTASGVFGLARFGTAGPRLIGLVSAGAGLAQSLGIEDVGGPVVLARNLTVLAAHAADVAVIEGATSVTDANRFRTACEAARRDGFNGKVATSAEQVAIIRSVFDREG